jgi:hypothetical protein
VKDRRLAATMQSYENDSLARTREVEIVEQTDPMGEHRTLMTFISPHDVQGTEFLHLSPARREGHAVALDQGDAPRPPHREAQQDENFFGSDLSYRDLELLVRIQQWTDADSTATLEGEETVDGKAATSSCSSRRTPSSRGAGTSCGSGRTTPSLAPRHLRQGQGAEARDGREVPERRRARDAGRRHHRERRREHEDVMTSRDVKYNTDCGEDVFTVSALGKSD